MEGLIHGGAYFRNFTVTYPNRVCDVRTDATLKHNSLLHGWLRLRARGTKSQVVIGYLVEQKNGHAILDVDTDLSRTEPNHDAIKLMIFHFRK